MPQSRPFLGVPASFTVAYPQFKSLVVRVRHSGDVARPHQKDEVYTESSIPKNVPCPNPRCQQGGYDLTGAIMHMAHSSEGQYKVRYSCNGHEGTPKGRRKGSPCMNFAEFKFEACFNE